MVIVEYPKGLYLRGWEDLDALVIVKDEGEEAAARAKGYRHINEPAPAAVEAAAEPVGHDDSPDAPKRRGRPPKVHAE